MKIKFKKTHESAVIPKYAHSTDACADMVAISREQTDEYISYDTGISLEIPEGFLGLLFPRSSITKKDLMLGNAVGVVDASYRGSISFRFKTIKDNDDSLVRDVYNVGDRVGQLLIIPFDKIEFVESEELDKTERNTGGYGSTGV